MTTSLLTSWHLTLTSRRAIFASFSGNLQVWCCHPFSDPRNCSHTQLEPDFKSHVHDQLRANIVTKYSAVSSERKPASCLGKIVFRRNTRPMTATKYRGHMSPQHWYPISVKPDLSMAPVRTRKALAPSSFCSFLCAARCQKAPWLMPVGKRRSSYTNWENGDFYYM